MKKTVPVVRDLTDLNVVGQVDYLLTSLLDTECGALIAEGNYEGESEWVLIDRRNQKRKSKVILKTDMIGQFRSILARIGNEYMDEGCLYGGLTNQCFVRDGKEYIGKIHMSNDGRFDFWIRIYITCIEK